MLSLTTCSLPSFKLSPVMAFTPITPTTSTHPLVIPPSAPSAPVTGNANTSPSPTLSHTAPLSPMPTAASSDNTFPALNTSSALSIVLRCSSPSSMLLNASSVPCLPDLTHHESLFPTQYLSPLSNTPFLTSQFIPSAVTPTSMLPLLISTMFFPY